jgi:hypothetical protein
MEENSIRVPALYRVRRNCKQVGQKIEKKVPLFIHIKFATGDIVGII